jgi:hypothetical protein
VISNLKLKAFLYYIIKNNLTFDDIENALKEIEKFNFVYKPKYENENLSQVCDKIIDKVTDKIEFKESKNESVG